MLSTIAGSFRDPSGRVFDRGDAIVRTVCQCYRPHWEQAVQSGLLASLVEKGVLLPFTEIAPSADEWKRVEVEKIHFITYPYEWSFPQLRDAALLTLELQRQALTCGMTLKDASAYNVQFRGSQPVFIDLLSFEKRDEQKPWQAYRQFCMHFLAPLALQGFDDRLSRLSALWIDGIPLDQAWAMLPARAAFSIGLQMHLHLHAKAEKRFEDGRVAASHTRAATLSTRQLVDVVDSLERTIKALPAPRSRGAWAEYYTDTNYTQVAEQQKQTLVEEASRRFAGKLAFDLGANTGKYSAVLARHFTSVIAVDLDSTAVARHYDHLRQQDQKVVLPLVVDLANPSPAVGWACKERDSFMQRGPGDLLCALALTHHLFFGSGIPWAEQAAFFNALLRPGGGLIVEFVPRDDSQVMRMLAARDDIFEEYSLGAFRQAFGVFFQETNSSDIQESCRKLFVFKKNGD